MKRRNKKGFTIVELVIVIAVIGILSAILIPTFINITSKAREASDASFVRNVNTAVAMDGKHQNMHDAVAAAEKGTGWDLDIFKPESGKYLVWDSQADRFAIVGETGLDDVIASDGAGIKATANYQLFAFYDDFDFENGEQKFSIYASDNWNLKTEEIGTEDSPLVVGFDAGDNDHFSKGIYKRGETAAEQDSVILNFGNCESLDFVIDAPTDSINRFGFANDIRIDAVADHSYHEFGRTNLPVVIKQGHIVLEPGSSVQVTVDPNEGKTVTATKKGGSSSVEYTGRAAQGVTFESVRLPNFVLQYQSRTNKNNLDSIQTIQNTPEPNRNTFYRNDDAAKGAEGGADIYKVGNDNVLDFPLYGIHANGASLTETVYKNPVGLTPTITKISGTGSAVPTWSNGKLNATNSEIAVGNVYQIQASGVSFQFQVVDGYNITDAKGLSLFDNCAALGEQQRIDVWANYKKAAFGNDYASLNPSALILHSDITLTNNDLPKDYFWSATEVEKYLRENPDVLRTYTNVLNSGRRGAGLDPLSEKEVKRFLSGSLRDDRAIYYRATGTELLYNWAGGKGYQASDRDNLFVDIEVENNSGDFAMEGNYFNIDASGIRQIAFFGTREQSVTTAESMPTLNLEEYSLLDGSHGALFGFNTAGGYKSNPFVPYRGDGGNVTIKNLSLLGNGLRSSDARNKGGLMCFKVDATTANFSNVNVSKFFTSYYSQIGYYKQTAFHPVLTVDRSKSFDSYNSMFYIYGTTDNAVTNSSMKNAGGPLVLLDERNRYVEIDEANGTYNGSTHGDYCGFVGEAPRLDATNVYFENYVLGTEPWFATKPPELVGSLMAQLKGNGVGWIEAKAASERAEGRIGKNFTKQIDEDIYMNFIGLDIDVGGLGSSGNGKAPHYYMNAYRGGMTINNTPGETWGKTASMEFADHWNTDGSRKFPYNQFAAAYATASSTAGMIFEGSEGGYGMALGDGAGGSIFDENFAAQNPATYTDPRLVQSDYMSIYIIQVMAAPWATMGVFMGMQ